MKDPNRIKPILERLETAWSNNPELLLYEIIAMTTHDTDIFDYKDDEELISYIEERIKEYESSK